LAWEVGGCVFALFFFFFSVLIPKPCAFLVLLVVGGLAFALDQHGELLLQCRPFLPSARVFTAWVVICCVSHGAFFFAGAGTYSPERSTTLVKESAPAFSMGKPKKVHRATDYLRF
jgi:hypothetical protein